MTDNQADITVFEHQVLRMGQGSALDEDTLAALQKHYGEKGVAYYSLVHNGVRFNEHVGVIQIGSKLIEVLPKADKHTGKGDENTWRSRLIGMLRSVGPFRVKSPGSSHLKLKANTVLDLYFELFISEVEYLLHSGLIKQYRQREGNTTALKGSLQFARHIQQNLVHQERFYVRYSTYDTRHQWHCLLYKTIRLLRQINTHTALHGRLGALLLNFPEMPDIRVNESTFAKLTYNRKTRPYQTAMEIARLLLLNYHPDVSKGRNHVLALMFDMNLLWEKFVYASLRKKLPPGFTITAQSSRYFWRPEKGYRSSLQPDMVIKDRKNCVVLDTKWKMLYHYNPTPDDLRQMYAYHHYFEAQRVALVYPGNKNTVRGGHYEQIPRSVQKTGAECAVLEIAVHSGIKQWQENIAEHCLLWMKPTEQLTS